MREKKFTWDARDAIAIVLAAVTITIALLLPTAVPPAVIVNTLAIALVLRPRTRCDLRDLSAAVTAAAAVVTVLVVPPAAAPAVTIASALGITLVLRWRR